MTATGTLEDGSWRFENRTSAVSRTEPHDCPKAIGDPEFDEIKSLVGIRATKVDTTMNVYTQVLDGAARLAADRVGSELLRVVQIPDGTTAPTH